MAESATSERFALGHIEEATAGREATMRATVSISREDYERYSVACTHVERLARTPFIVKHLNKNFSAVEATFDHLTALLLAGRKVGTPDRRDLLEALAGQIVNWLTAMRLFLDHTAGQLSQRFGKESAEYLEFTRATNSAFDGSNAYRFIFKFRNYVQHRGTPLSRLTITAGIEGSPGSVDFLLVRDDLIRDFGKWGAPVTKDLREGPSEFPLRPLIKETMAHLTALHRLVMQNDIKLAASTVGALEEAAARLPEAEGTPTLFRIRSASDGEQIDTEVQSLQTLAIRSLRPVADGIVDPLSIIRPVEPVSTTIDADTLRAQLHPNSRGVQAISAWLAEDPPGKAFDVAINKIIDDDGDPSDLVIGLINVSALLLHMTALSIGADSKRLLASLYTDYAANLGESEADQRQSRDVGAKPGIG